VPHHLREASLQVVAGRSAVIPLVIEGLPDEIEVLGERWQRKREFHLTAVSAQKLEWAGGGRPDLWEVVTRVASGRTLGPVVLLDEVRRVTAPERPGLRTLVAMAHAPALDVLHRDLSQALGAELEPQPAHVTLYSNDPGEGIGLEDHAQLQERAPALPEEQQEAIRRAMRFEEVFFDDDGIALDPPDLPEVSLGRTDPVFTPTAIRAIAYAAHVHRDQRRKGGNIPYLAHLLAVAALVAEEGGGETEVVAALLHDAAEDHGGEERLADIRGRFGAQVAGIVRALSDSLRPEEDVKEEWLARKERYLGGLRGEGRPEVLRVSNADKVHNAHAILADHRALGDEVWRRFEAPPHQQLVYYRQLATIFCARRPGAPLAAELAQAVAELERLVGS
jgi:HD domain